MKPSSAEKLIVAGAAIGTRAIGGGANNALAVPRLGVRIDGSHRGVGIFDASVLQYT
ncbi:hypothetical protein D9M71_733770 [compost metagenome]